MFFVNSGHFGALGTPVNLSRGGRTRKNMFCACRPVRSQVAEGGRMHQNGHRWRRQRGRRHGGRRHRGRRHGPGRESELAVEREVGHGENRRWCRQWLRQSVLGRRRGRRRQERLLRHRGWWQPGRLQLRRFEQHAHRAVLGGRFERGFLPPLDMPEPRGETACQREERTRDRRTQLIPSKAGAYGLGSTVACVARVGRGLPCGFEPLVCAIAPSPSVCA